MIGRGKGGRIKSEVAAVERKLTEGQRAYEAKRAAKAGLTLERWLADKDRVAREEQAAVERAKLVAATPPKRPGLFKRLLERAHKPL